MKKLKDLKKTLSLKMEKLSERELSFITGGGNGSTGSSGTGSGSTDTSCTCCDGATVHCCPQRG